MDWVGIDISKATLAVARGESGRAREIANDATGWQALIRHLRTDTPAGVVMEATGSYHVGVMVALADAGMPAAVINPRRMRAFIDSEGVRTKTDHADARLLARFGQQKRPAPSPVASAVLRDLAALVGRREDLVKMLVMEKNRRQVAMTDWVAADIDAAIAALGARIAAVETRMTEVIDADAALAERRARVQTTPGVGAAISAVLVAGLPELGAFDAKAIAALAGIAPHPRDSGVMEGPRTIGGGRPQVRKALYQMAVTAVRCDPVMRAHYQQLRVRRPFKVAIIACARRMLGILTMMVRDGLAWQETRVGQGQFLPPSA